MKEISLTRKSVWGTAILALILFSGGGRIAARPINFRKPDISYIGSNEEFLQFSVNFTNEAQEKFLFEIYDDSRKILYRRKFTGSEFNKKIYLYKAADYNNVTFSIRSGKKQYKQTITVNPEFTPAENKVATKL